ncbi:MAG TPA: UDP-N-acetylmuramoyl-L-alanine--D-glutamate ligase [Candidatus Polarisedimenticolia bacterium]|jgi:UDP-N-acetylmuramoylalanine--D-glutamate ligase|nr:UDP-N-acetylmuramoyl-L-alanine--D-glutamate ligase [Candidatus Polarisedimenticolia bacterium]
MHAIKEHPSPPKLGGSRVVVVGAQASGLAMARFLLSRQARVVLTDVRGWEELGPAVAELARDGAKLELGMHSSDTFAAADLVAVSPGVPLSIAPIAEARRRGVRVVGEIELASWFLQGILIGITGTNGKSTTTALTAHLLSGAGLKATACGNIGLPLTDLIPRDAPDHYYVVELSSFQLEAIDTFRPWIAALLNLAPDHLDRYDSPLSYYHAKTRIFKNQGPADNAILNRDDPEVWGMAGTLKSRLHPFSRALEVEDGAFLRDASIVVRSGGREIRSIPLEKVTLFGAHNIENVMTALLIADLCGVPLPRAERGLASFRGLPHRLEKVRQVGGVAYFNDSKATNVAATMKSLESFPRNVVLILGGKDKGGDFTELLPLIRGRVEHLVLMGQARDAIASQIGAAVPTTKVVTMAEAVEAARSVAPAAGVVLLAPACASYDQYTGFEARGEDFRRLVLALEAGG